LLRLRVRELVGRPSRAADTAEHMGWFGPSKAEKAAAAKKLYWAARDGDEAELTRLIGLGGSVNWHNPSVRRRMCLAWAPATTPPLLLRSPPPRPPDTAPSSPQPSCMARAAPPRARPFVSPLRPLRMARVCVQQCGSTALMDASNHGHEGCVRLLLASGANVNDTMVSLERPLPSTRHGSASMQSFRSSPPFCLQDWGWTALHFATRRLAIAKRLLEGGADPTLRDKDGGTAIDYARKEGYSEVVALLSEPRYADGDRTECESNADLNANRMRNRMRIE
jgi:hypothetical protein